MRYILHYTKPGDIVFDGFCGTGMTVVAAQMCGDLKQLTSMGFSVNSQGDISDSLIDDLAEQQPISKLGVRKCIVNDLSPAAAFIARNYTGPLQSISVLDDINKALSLVEKECAYMFQTQHSQSLFGEINFVVWSDVFVCPECHEEVIYWNVAVDTKSDSVKKTIYCEHCSSLLDKRKLERVWALKYDSSIGKMIKQAKQVPVKINYTYQGKRFEKIPDSYDLDKIAKIEELDIPYWFPIMELQEGYNTKQPLSSHGISHVHHFYTKRCLYSISSMFDKLEHPRSKFILTAIVRTLTKMFRWAPKGKHTAGTSGTLYIPSITHEYPIFGSIVRRLKIYEPLFSFLDAIDENVIVSNGDMSCTGLNENTVDYIFIDPPFGANINYSELNVIWEAWLGVKTDI